MNCNAKIADFYNPFLDNLCNSPATAGKAVAIGGDATGDKAAAALKNHSEAEKRRRERINGHFATLRTLIPGSSKMDKATLLAEAIEHLKEVEKAATEATRGLVIPLDSDEIIVEEVIHVTEGKSFVCVKASVCCEYTHELLSDLKQSLYSLQLKLLRVELGTFNGRMKSVFFVSSYGEGAIQGSRSHNKSVSGSVKRALRSVLDGFLASQELSLSNDMFSSKRQRASLLGRSSGISASGDLW